tara:strand:+ start:872 stop:1051 length:180 start_codon:yes stop_codon:yes gene_type:complete
MNRFKRNFCKEKIAGYLMPRVNETSTESFNRAKSEAVKAYKQAVEDLENYKFEYMVAKK